MMTMKQACEYVKNSRLERAMKHRAEVTKGDLCGSFTDREYKKISISQKSNFAKGKKASYNSVWRHNDLPIIKATI